MIQHKTESAANRGTESRLPLRNLPCTRKTPSSKGTCPKQGLKHLQPHLPLRVLCRRYFEERSPCSPLFSKAPAVFHQKTASITLLASRGFVKKKGACGMLNLRRLFCEITSLFPRRTEPLSPAPSGRPIRARYTPRAPPARPGAGAPALPHSGRPPGSRHG